MNKTEKRERIAEQSMLRFKEEQERKNKEEQKRKNKEAMMKSLNLNGKQLTELGKSKKHLGKHSTIKKVKRVNW